MESWLKRFKKGYAKSQYTYLKNVVISGQNEVLASESEGNVGHLGDFAALNQVLAIQEGNGSNGVLDLEDSDLTYPL